jgi:hypothetical protein
MSLSDDDLRRVAKAQTELERFFFDRSTGLPRADRSCAIGAIEVIAPDDGTVIGSFILKDSWVGFVPIGADE